MATTVTEVRKETFEQVIGVPPSVAEAAILNRDTAGETSLDEVLERLSHLLGIKKLEALRVLGISRSRKSKNPNMNVDLLDRTFVTLDVFSRVSRILGTDAAKHWFQTPKQALDGAIPLVLLETRVGVSKLQDMITALEDGAYL